MDYQAALSEGFGNIIGTRGVNGFSRPKQKGEDFAAGTKDRGAKIHFSLVYTCVASYLACHCL